MLKVTKVLVLSLLVVCMASAAFATTSRVISLAGTVNYINDDSNIFKWYGTLPSYSNMVMAEFGQANAAGGASGPAVSTEYQALGFTYSLGEESSFGTWGFFILNNSIEDMSFFAFQPFKYLGDGPALGIPTPTTKLVLFWGKEFNAFSLGVMYTNSNASLEQSGLTTLSLSYNEIGAGARIDMGDAMYGDVQLTLGFAGGDPDSNLVTGAAVGFSNGSAFSIGARLFWEVRDDATLVPYFEYNASNYGLEIDPNAVGLGGSNGDDESAILLGAAVNYDVNTSNMLVFGAEIQSLSWTYSNVATNDQSEITELVLPKWFVALESDITAWLTTRVGATKTLSKLTIKDPTGGEQITTFPLSAGGDFEWSLGAGFHLGDWDLDAVLSNDLPFRMGYWITGANGGDTTPPIARLSGVYRF